MFLIDVFENSIWQAMFRGIVQAMPHKNKALYGFLDAHYEALPGQSKKSLPGQIEFSKRSIAVIYLCVHRALRKKLQPAFRGSSVSTLDTGSGREIPWYWCTAWYFNPRILVLGMGRFQVVPFLAWCVCVCLIKDARAASPYGSAFS